MVEQPFAASTAFPEHKPDTLYFGCIDARLKLGALGLEMGNTLVNRKIGGLLDPNDPELAATLEFAIGVMKVKRIITSGHLDCGAAAACVNCNGAVPKVLEYMSPMEETRQALAERYRDDKETQKREMEKAIVKHNLDILRSFEMVREAESKGELTLAGWLLDVRNPERGDKSVLGEDGMFTHAPLGPSWPEAIMTASRLEALMCRGAEFLGTPHAIMGGAMSWVSERNLVAALSHAGAFGVIACGSMPPELLEREIEGTKALLAKPSPFRGEGWEGALSMDSELVAGTPSLALPPGGGGKNFGVNLILMHPQLEELVAVCARQRVSHVVLAGGIPSGNTVKALKDAGIKVMAFAPSAIIGRKLVRLGVDALVIEGMEAGGHTGPVSTTVLAQEILPHIRDVPVFVAGGIGRGEAMVSYLKMGASGVQLGTRFVCATECIAHAKFKEMFIRANARDAVLSVQVDPDFPVIPVRALANKATNDFMRFQHQVIKEHREGGTDKKEAQLKIEHFWAGALRRAVIDGDIDHGSVMAGQSVGMVSRIQPMREIVAELVAQAEQFLLQRSTV